MPQPQEVRILLALVALLGLGRLLGRRRLILCLLLRVSRRLLLLLLVLLLLLLLLVLSSKYDCFLENHLALVALDEPDNLLAVVGHAAAPIALGLALSSASATASGAKLHRQ